MALQPEQIIHIQVVDWVRACTDLPVLHFGNERRCSPQHGAILKRMGVVSGASDLFFPRSNGKHHGLFIELKTLKGKLSPSQIKFLENMNQENYFALVCRGAEEAITFIKTFYNLPANDVPFNRV